jgi:signal transduction histidine kinase
LSVQDSGPGIPLELLEHIFDRFDRGETDASVPGFGLGLPIAKALAEGQGGTIQIESEVGTGTRVTVLLPLFIQED